MNKNMKLGIAVLMVALFVGLTYGAVVTYLSNKVTADITVTSPMLVGVSLGKGTWGGDRYPEGSHDLTDWTTGKATLIISGIHGGETITIYLMSENLADAEITGFEEVIVYNSKGVTGADFESVVFRTDSIYGDLGYGTKHDLIALGKGTGYKLIDANHIRFGTEDSTWGARETDVTEIVVTFEEAAVGTYTISYQVVPAP